MNTDGLLLSYESFVVKFKVNISRKGYVKICKAIAVPLLRLIQNSMCSSSIISSLPSSNIDQINLLDKKCNNKWITQAFNRKVFCNFDKNTRLRRVF